MFQAWINHNTFEKISEHDPKQAHPTLIKKHMYLLKNLHQHITNNYFYGYVNDINHNLIKKDKFRIIHLDQRGRQFY
jgi:hypothetical protein